MTTQQPPTQPDYLAEVAEIAATLHGSYMRLHDIMRRYETQPQGGEAGSEEWADCYLASQALHLAIQLTRVAIGSEQERREPVPYLPAEVAEFAEYLVWRRRAPFDPNLAGGVTALTVEDGS